MKLGQVIPVQIYVHVQRETVLCRGENLDSEARGRVASDQCVTQAALSIFVVRFLTVKMEIIKAPPPGVAEDGLS